MPIYVPLILMAVGLSWILTGLPCAVFPRRTKVWERHLYRKIRLISAKKFNKPIKQRAVILQSLQGWIFFFAGVTLLWQLPIQFSLYRDGNAYSSYFESAVPGNDANNIYSEFKVKVDEVIQPLIDTNKSVGVSVGIIGGEGTVVFGYGRVNTNSNHQPDGDTIYEIGSITKVFTALLLANMDKDGLVSLTDTVQKFLPPSIQMPVYDDTEITLIDLVSHMSGLPRIPNNLNNFKDYLSLDFVKNPYASYTPSRLYAFLSKHSLKTKPGTKYSYSNVGMGLLGHILACSQTKTYEDMVLSRICTPLAMNDTRITLSRDQKSRLAQGYQGVFTISSLYLSFPATNWDIPTLAGAGALRSTVNDLLKFLLANIGITQTPLNKAMETTQVVRHKIKPTMSIAMGWHIQGPNCPDDSIVWHNGGTGGYKSYMGFNKKHRVGVVILSNSTSSVDEAGVRILRTLLPD
ncbi:MAG: beta-lactamase family protein [Planctomycetes bacterium]|nr:beta-lactamase family protein [Planctomycetota bacterium]MCH8118353.1 beta-lactamase family protein [Planctomycetota bacterium]